ncbi:hypothetical protein LRP88_11740 [Fusarium phalaenopsidis]
MQNQVPYYDWLPILDLTHQITAINTQEVLIPQEWTGFAVVMAIIAAHFAVTALTMVLFAQRTESSLLSFLTSNSSSCHSSVAGDFSTSGSKMGHIAPLDIQDPSDLDAILRDRRLLDLEVYVWEPTRKSIEYRHRLGAWRVAERKKARPDAEFWGPRSELYYQGEPDDIGTSGTLPIKPDGIWQSLPPCSTREYSCPRKLPDASIVVAEHEKSVKEALCEQCAKIPVGKLLLSEQSYKLCDKASHLDVNSCRLCRMIFRHIKKSSQQTEQVSLAILHGTGSKEYFRLLQKWLDESSASGRELCPYYLPSRLIHITHSEDHFKLRLIKTEEFKFSSPRYIALSHRWGGIDTFCTTADNFHERLNDIPYSELPKTFQHAVITTWNLGVKYLWIDSLCIIQRNASDWRH